MFKLPLLGLVVLPAAGAAPRPPEFINDVLPVLTRAGCNSGACHGALAGKGGLKLSLRGYDPEADYHALTLQALGRRANPREPDASLMLLKATKAVPHGGGRRFRDDSDEYRRIHAWLAAGAPGPDANAPKLVGVSVAPAAARKKVGDTHRLSVTAQYADGRVEDVTAWAKFATTADAVAAVDEYGTVTAAGPGEAAVSVWYAGRVAATVVTVPHEREVDAAVLAGSPRHNFIDRHVLDKLQSLQIPPSPACTDREFIRRVFLDTIGTLPTPAEVDRFAADAAADKRARLVDALLQRPEYVDYWSYKWSDLFLVSSRRLSQPATWAFYRGLRQAVADNVPWDRLAREVLTARGSNLANGLGNYYVLHKDPAERVEATAVTFLGTSLTCARCHNHPLEKWTQDQYWAFANLFGRVGLKSGDHKGEIVVFDAPAGDVPHLRRGVPLPPAPLDAAPLKPDAERRHALADWLARDNPAFAKAMVNRVWRNYFGRGLVEAEDDLRDTNPPSHPELLEELAADSVKHGYDLRHLIRRITASAAYQRSAGPVAGNEADDRFYSRCVPRRLPAEVLLDAYAQVTLVPTDFKQIYTTNKVPTDSSLYPPGTRAQQLPDAWVVSRFLDAFGRPARDQPCACERQSEASTEQALHLNNGATLNDKLKAKDSVVSRWLADRLSDAEAVRQAFRLGLGREPTSSELERQTKLLAEYEGDRRAAFEDLCWAVFTSREFLFNH
jgi:hypothetical protein